MITVIFTVTKLNVLQMKVHNNSGCLLHVIRILRYNLASSKSAESFTASQHWIGLWFRCQIAYYSADNQWSMIMVHQKHWPTNVMYVHLSIWTQQLTPNSYDTIHLCDAYIYRVTGEKILPVHLRVCGWSESMQSCGSCTSLWWSYLRICAGIWWVIYRELYCHH